MGDDKVRSDVERMPFHIVAVFDDKDDLLRAWQHLVNIICDDHAPSKEVSNTSSSRPRITNTFRFKSQVQSIQGGSLILMPKLTGQLEMRLCRFQSKPKPHTSPNCSQKSSKTSAIWKSLKSNSASQEHLSSLVLTDEGKASLMNSYFAMTEEKLASALPYMVNNPSHILQTCTLSLGLLQISRSPSTQCLKKAIPLKPISQLALSTFLRRS